MTNTTIDGVSRGLLERIAGDSYQDSLRAVGELRDLLAASPAPSVVPAFCAHGAYDDDAACMDCLKAWGQWPFKAPDAKRQGGRSVPFDALCYGAKFKYAEGDAAEWVKVGHNTVAGWKVRNVATKWVAQPLCLFCDDDNFSAPVWLLDDTQERKPLTSPECKTCGGTRVVDDGELTCSAGGIPYAMGPIKCVKDCPDCRPAPACSTCQDHGVIGWTTGQTAESFDQGEAPCPDCSEAAKPVAVVKHVAMGCIDWLIWPRDLPLGTKLYASPPAPVLPEPEQLFEAISGALGEAMDCTRVWAAWGVGTMSEDDFVLVADDQERLREIASACLTKIKESNQ